MIHKRQEFYVIGFNEVGSTSVVLEQMFQTNRTVVCLRRPPTQKQSTSTSGDGAIYIYTSAPLPTAPSIGVFFPDRPQLTLLFLANYSFPPNLSHPLIILLYFFSTKIYSKACILFLFNFFFIGGKVTVL